MNQILIIGTTDSIILASVVTEVLPVTFYLLFQKKNRDNSLRVIFYLLIVNFFNDLYGFYKLRRVEENILTFNIYLLIETVTICIFFAKILSRSFIKPFLTTIISIFIALWLFQFIKVGQAEALWDCVNYENIFIMLVATYFYYEKIFLLNEPLIYDNTTFWVVSAFFLNAAGTFFLLLYISTLPSKEDQEGYYNLNYVFTILRTILLSIAMLMKNTSLDNQKHPINLGWFQK